MLGLRGELLIPESPHGKSNACTNAAWLGRVEVKRHRAHPPKQHLLRQHTGYMSKQTHRCRRQKCKHCKQKLICTWDMHVCKPAHTRKQPTGNQALVQHRHVLTGCGQMRSSDVNRGGRRRASRSVARVLRMCVCVCVPLGLETKERLSERERREQILLSSVVIFTCLPPV